MAVMMAHDGMGAARTFSFSQDGAVAVTCGLTGMAPCLSTYHCLSDVWIDIHAIVLFAGMPLCSVSFQRYGADDCRHPGCMQRMKLR